MNETAVQTIRTRWDADGYIVVPGMITEGEAASLLTIAEDVLAQWRGGLVPDQKYIQKLPTPSSYVMRFFHHPIYFSSHPEWMTAILECAADERLLGIARQVLDSEPIFRTTSLFMNPLGITRDGDWHRDSQYLTRTDEAEKAMIFGRQAAERFSVQIALVPTEDSQFVPGSHLRWDSDAEYHIRKADGCRNCESNDMPNAVRVALAPGDGVAFNPWTLHRGRYHADRLRRTLMITYTSREGALTPDAFNMQPWFLQPGFLDPLSESARRFYENYIDYYAHLWADQSSA